MRWRGVKQESDNSRLTSAWIYFEYFFYCQWFGCRQIFPTLDSCLGRARGLESRGLTLVPSLFYIRLISLTAGTLVYLFLLALILGHRRPRTFERILFFLNLSLFLIYAGGLLEINALIQYGTPPYTTRLFYWSLQVLGMAFLPALLVHVHFAYLQTIQGR